MGLENKYYYEEGIILGRKKVGEGDLLLVIYGKNKGKFFAKAPGALKIKNRLRGRVDIFTLGKGFFVKRKELDLLINWEVYERFNEIFIDVNRFLTLSKFIKEVEEIIPFEIKDLEIFRIIYYFLKYWEKSDEVLGNIFVIKILQKLGYLSPILLKCQKCGKDLLGEECIYIDISSNKAFCIECRKIGFYLTKTKAILEYNSILNTEFEDLIEKRGNKLLKDLAIWEVWSKIKSRIEQEV